MQILGYTPGYKMAKTNLTKRRQIRALEAKRDKLTEQIAADKTKLALTREELKRARKV